jgi:hypothetical protein
VRLRKGFVNVEKAPFGGLKLRIPTLLYVEKMRTQSRFNVSGGKQQCETGKFGNNILKLCVLGAAHAHGGHHLIVHWRRFLVAR